jgi:hypothetical protein
MSDPKAVRESARSDSPTPKVPDDSATGLPGLRSWRAVYAVVLGVFVLWVGLLTVLTEFYS